MTHWALPHLQRVPLIVATEQPQFEGYICSVTLPGLGVGQPEPCLGFTTSACARTATANSATPPIRTITAITAITAAAAARLVLLPLLHQVQAWHAMGAATAAGQGLP